MKKVFKLFLGFIVVITLGFVFFYVSALSGGIKGLWYDITKPSIDPYSSQIIKKREFIKNKIVHDFDYVDSAPNVTKYGVHNTDLCLETNYSYMRPMSNFDNLYTCKYISQRYYGIDGKYESSVRALMEYITKNKEGLRFQPYQTEQLFVQKDWMQDAPTINKILSSYNSKNKGKPYTNINEVVSFIAGQNESTINAYSPSKDGYDIRLDFFDGGFSPADIESSSFYEISDSPDLRKKYIAEINKNHPYGVVVTITYTYYKK